MNLGHRRISYSKLNLGMSSSGYRDQGVQGGSPSRSPNRQFGSSRAGAEREEEEQRAQDFSGRKRRGSLVYDDYLGAQKKEKERSLASYDSRAAGSQALKISTSASGSKQERFMSPYGDYDMDDSSFFARTTRLNIVGPTSSSARMLRRRSSSMERSLISCGQRTMVTTATSTQKMERSRSLSPPAELMQPALAPEKLTSPTESYMKLSLQSSLPLTDPTTSRKLLVLDLNGTLLLRSSHSGRRAPPPSYSRVRHSVDTLSRPRTMPSSAPHPHPAPRTIYPRPYIPSFRAYIFHSTTLQWLDTMVWSSAQPHSVNDMVDKCFGTYKEDLKAIWARDTLGLSSDEYYKKTQTTKDLAKPWAQIPSLLSNLSRSPSPPQQPLSASENLEFEAKSDNYASPLPQQQQQQQQHSALTTVLMDDSPLKAALQPWNHLCVSEYGSERRKLDLDIAERELEHMWLAERERAKEMSSLEATADEERRTGYENGMEDKETERKRKRKEKKIFKKEKLLLAKEQQLEALEKEEVEEENYDETLLAVIGILDTLKHEGNVAGWMKSGGLIHVVAADEDTNFESIDGSATTHAPPSENAEAQTIATTRIRTSMTIPSPPTTIAPTSPSTPSTKRDRSSTSVRGSSKRRRLTHVIDSSDAEMDSVSVPAAERWAFSELGSDSEMVVDTLTTFTTTKRSPSTPPPSSPLSSSAQAEQASTGILPTTPAAGAPSSPPHPGRMNSSLPTTPSPTQQQPPLWYETPSTLSYWVQHGRRALADLGIDIISGVVPPSQNNGNTTAGGGG